MQSLGAVSTGLGGSGARQKYLPPYLREPAPAPEPAPSALPAARTQVRISCTHGAVCFRAHSLSVSRCLSLSRCCQGFAARPGGAPGAGLSQGPRQAWGSDAQGVGGGRGGGGPWNRSDEPRQDVRGGGAFGGRDPSQGASSFSAGDARSGLSGLPGAGDTKANFGRGLARTAWQGLDGDAGFDQRIEEDRQAFAAEFGNKFHAAGINFDKYADIKVHGRHRSSFGAVSIRASEP